MNLTPAISKTVRDLYASAPRKLIRHRSEIIDIARSHGAKYQEIGESLMRSEFRSGRGEYDVSSFFAALSDSPHQTSEPAVLTIPPPPMPKPAALAMVHGVSSTVNADAYVPEVDPYFVKWGSFTTISKVIRGRNFCPTFISGLSGNGKTVMVEQACAQLKREYIRVQIAPETDEDDLIGGFRLINGETVFAKGPVIKAMERGCILLIDEIDRGSNKIMCLQGVMEGKPVLIKKTGEIVVPAPGFNVFATANTKGRGSEDGRFAAAVMIDEAFLERFVITIEQDFAPEAIEKKIVMEHMTKYDAPDEEFASNLVAWAGVIRKTHTDGGVDELISTRRLCHIVQTFSIFLDRMEAITLCTARFDADTRASFADLYTKIDKTVNAAPPVVQPAPTTEAQF